MGANMSDKYIKVGKYSRIINDILGLDFDDMDIYRSSGLLTHLLKRKHYRALKYIDLIPDIISSPDYVGSSVKSCGDTTVEFVKCLKHNILLGVKLDSTNSCMYVATVYDLQESKLQRRLHSGRLQKFTVPDQHIHSNELSASNDSKITEIAY